MRITVYDVQRCIGCGSCTFACARRAGNGGLSNTAIAVRSSGGISKGFSVIVCRACPDPPCAKVCPTNALIPRKGGGVILNPAKCIGCKNCQEACPIGAVFWNEETNKPVICVQCGYCVEFCPHGVLRMEDSEVEAHAK